MDWHETVFELIDLRSFSNLWFWIALAVLWSSASHWVLGVPYDLVMRAKRKGGSAQEDLEAIVRVNCNRLIYMRDVAGSWVVMFSCFMLAILITVGFWYGNEFAQAVVLLIGPMTLVGALSIRTAGKIRADGASGRDLYRYLARQRIATQFIGMIAIFVTALWGMYQNYAVSPLY